MLFMSSMMFPLFLPEGVTIDKVLRALKIVIPPTVGILISAFKDTSPVVIIALYDILNTTKSILTEPEWTGFSTEASIFIAMIYYICCFSMSHYSRRIEKQLEYKHTPNQEPSSPGNKSP